jgi:hypothetical protein
LSFQTSNLFNAFQKIRNEPLDCRERVFLFSFADMPVITFSALVVVANNSFAIPSVTERVFQSMWAFQNSSPAIAKQSSQRFHRSHIPAWLKTPTLLLAYGAKYHM